VIRHFAQTTLGTSNLQEIVKLPEGEDKNEWCAMHVVDFYHQVHLLYGAITESCTPSTCPVMSAGSRYEYLWADNATFKRPTKVIWSFSLFKGLCP
jgi:MOB kinase activator 1